jgi:hypothetical protein
MPNILNQIALIPLNQKLQNGKHAHHLIKGSSIIIKMQNDKHAHHLVKGFSIVINMQ